MAEEKPVMMGWLQSPAGPAVAPNNLGTTELKAEISRLSRNLTQAQHVCDDQQRQIIELQRAAKAEPKPSETQLRGEALAREKMAMIVRENPDDRYVAFCLDTGEFVTARTESSLINKFDSEFQNRPGWITLIVPGGHYDSTKGLDR